MREGAQNRYRCLGRCLTPRPVHAYSLYRICCYWFHSASGFMQMLPLPLPLATTSLVGLNIFLCFASFLSFSFFCFVTASAAFPWFWRSMSESFPWAAAASSQVHVMLLHSCERALLLLQQSRAFMPLAFWKLDRITIILLDFKVTFRKWVEWVRKRRHKQTTQTNRPLGFSRESDQIWHFHCCFVFSRAINEFQWKRGLHFNEDYHIQTDTQTM